MRLGKHVMLRLLHPLWKADAKRKADLLGPWIGEGDHLLEIGTGPGTLLRELSGRGYRVQSLDIEDQRLGDDLPEPVIYNGTAIPFEAETFDVALLFTVLHHCVDPEQVFREAGRVSRAIAIVEDVYESPRQKRLTQITDSLVNAEFRGHPHEQRSEAGWRELFAREGWEVAGFDSWPLFGFYRQCFFWLVPEKRAGANSDLLEEPDRLG